jgi:serine/threonine protein kinase
MDEPGETPPGTPGAGPHATSIVRSVGRYEILREVGRGGMAVVYLARQRDLDRLVALKELSSFHASAPEFAERFLRESRLAGSLSHPNIVTVHEYFEEGGIPYIAMEYVPQGSLRQWVGSLSLAQLAGAMEGILAGLAHAEPLGIVHRDLKPENIMVTSEGRVKITDFGIAKATQSAGTAAFMTATGTTVGTPTYMAPEQAMAQQLGPWTDLYSVGVMAYEQIVGRPPFHDTDTPMAILLRHVKEPIPPLVDVKPDVDPALSDWVERLLVKEPEDRTRSAIQAWEELEEIVLKLLGPRWRREARLPERGPTTVTPLPLTPAPFQSQRTPAASPAAPSQQEAESQFITFGRAPEPPPAPVQEPAPAPTPEPAPPPPPDPTPSPPPTPTAAPPPDPTPSPPPTPTAAPPPDPTPSPPPTPTAAPPPDPTPSPPPASTAAPPPEPTPPAPSPEPAPPPAPEPPPAAAPEPPLARTPEPLPAPPVEPPSPPPSPPEESPAAVPEPLHEERPPASEPAPVAISEPRMAAAAEPSPAGAHTAARAAPSGVRRAGSYRLAGVAAALVLAAGAGFALAPSSGSAGASALSGSAANSSFEVAYPTGWQQQTSVPTTPGLPLSSALALAAPSAGGELVIGSATPDGPTLLPASFLSALPSSPRGEAVHLGSSEFYRYRDLQPNGAAGPETVYALASSSGAVVGVCVLPSSGPGVVATDCERILGSLKLTSGSALALGPSRTYAATLSHAMSTLNSIRASAGAQLAKAGTAKAQAAAAERLARAHEQAAAAVRAATPGSAERSANAAIAAALSRIAGGYAAMAAAAHANDSGSYDGARRTVGNATIALTGALRELQKLGYG